MDFEVRFLVFSGRKPFLDRSLLGVRPIKRFLPLGLAVEQGLYFSLDAAWLICSHDSPCIFDDTISLAFITRTVQILLARAAVGRSPSSSNSLRLARLLCGAPGYCSFIQWLQELAEERLKENLQYHLSPSHPVLYLPLLTLRCDAFSNTPSCSFTGFMVQLIRTWVQCYLLI